MGRECQRLHSVMLSLQTVCAGHNNNTLMIALLCCVLHCHPAGVVYGSNGNMMMKHAWCATCRAPSPVGCMWYCSVAAEGAATAQQQPWSLIYLLVPLPQGMAYNKSMFNNKLDVLLRLGVERPAGAVVMCSLVSRRCCSLYIVVIHCINPFDDVCIGASQMNMLNSRQYRTWQW